SIRPEKGNPSNFGELDALLCRGRVDDPADPKIEPVRLLLQNSACDREYIALEFVRCLQRSLAADARSAAGPGRATMRRHFRVAGDDLHPRAIDAQTIGDDLANNGFGALPQFGDRDQAMDIAG